jgi:uncharacterized protein YukE
MADPRTFTLIGEFKDGITPELAKINKQLASLKSSFGNIGGKGARTASRDISKFNSAVSSLNDTLKTQNQVLRSTIEPMRQYRREVGKTIGALNRLDAAGGRSISIERTNKALQEQIRLMDQLRSRAGRTSPGGGYGGGGGGGRTRPLRSSRRGGGGGEAFGSGSNFHMGSFAFGMSLGQGIADPVQSAIFSGFQMGVGLLQKSFQYIAGAFAERVQDEMGDLSAAGGYYSIAQRQKDPFVKSLQQAVDFTQETNAIMARLASSLPGDTQDYVNVSKRIGDSIARMVAQNEKGAIEYAKKLRTGQEGTYTTSLEGPDARKGAMQVIMGELTKKTVMAGFGGSAGVGGQKGPHGLPALMERMLTNPDITESQLNRYAAIFGDPKISSALGRYMPKLKEAGADMLKRAKILNEMYDEIVPPEMIAAMRNSMAGMTEAFRSAFLNPEVGFLGIGRKLKAFAPKLNLYGQYIDEAGNVVQTAAEAAKADIGVYEMFRDILANFGAVLMPIVDNLSLLWDPMKEIGDALQEARKYSVKFLTWFRNYNAGILKYGEELKKTDAAGAEKLLSTRNLRASMATINNMFRAFGVIDSGKFKATGDLLIDPNADLAKIMAGMVETFFTSDAAKKVGEFVGNLLGTILSQIATMTGFFSKRLKGSKLGEGFAQAFKESGGVQALKNIFKDIYILLLEGAKLVLQALPWEAYALAAAGLLLPATIQGLAMEFGQKMAGMFGSIGTRMIGGVEGGGRGRRRGGGFMQTREMRRQQILTQRAMRRGVSPYLQGAQTLGAFGKDAFMSSRAGRGFASAANTVRGGLSAAVKVVPGAAAAGGLLSGANSLMQGEGVGRAIAQTFGTVLGATAGSVFGPVGTVIGGMAGDALTRSLINKFDPTSIKQEMAAKLQMEAAARQLDAAKINAVKPTSTPYAMTSQELQAALALNGVTGRQAQILVEQAKQRNVDLASLTRAREALETAKRDFGTVYKPDSKEFQNAIKPYQAAVNSAAKALSTSQTTFQTNFNKIPGATRDAIVKQIATMSTGQIEAAFARKVDQMQVKATIDARNIQFVQAGGTPGITPVSQAEMDRRNATKQSYGRYFSGNNAIRTSLGKALSSEMRNKPSGSDLVIANSSETVIPAAGGYGMLDLVTTLRSGFNTMILAYREAQQKQDTVLKAIKDTLVSNQQQTNARLQKLETKFSTPAMGGLGGGSIGGGVDSFTGMAQKYGLQMTSGYRPGDPGWHGANRARDYSNGTGPTPQMMQFAQFLASNYGSNLKELIYTPLGFSIKNGQKVAPYATSGHYNHVHVAYALGAGNPAFFGSQSAALNWERSMMPGSVKVGSVTGNSAEGFGGNTFGDINVTVNAGATSDPDALASLVALKIGEAVADARSASIFV